MSANNVSALIATYGREKAEYLEVALESIYAQTCPPGEVVIVVDGPIDAGQQAVIDHYTSDDRVPVTKVIRMGLQSGLAAALNAGLTECTGDFVMRMDSDDISDLERLSVQMEYIRNNPQIDMVGSYCLEFETSGQPLSMKAGPTEHDDIIKALRWRNILVHPSVIIRRTALAAVGNYRTVVGKLEDYDLFVRLVLNGSRIHVIPQPLLHGRVSIDQRRRRGGFRHLLHDIQFRAEIRRTGFLSWAEFMASVGAYSFFRLIPASFRGSLYSLVRSRPAMEVASMATLPGASPRGPVAAR
jgi:glycosyltransferase involved in cell wall biosynthesis